MKYIVISLIVISMITIPYSVHGVAPYIIYGISLISLFGVFLKVPGSELLLVAIALCLPLGMSSTGVVFPEVNRMKNAFQTILMLIPFISGYILLQRKNIESKQILTLMILMALLGAFFAILTRDLNEFLRLFRGVALTFGFFVLCYYDKKISIEDVFVCFDILFIISLYYGISDFLFHNSPYQYMTEATLSLNYGRARGILGHALFLSGLAIIYQSIIFIRYMITNKFNYVQEFLCIIMALIVISRTTAIVMFVEFLLFFMFNFGKKKLKFLVLNIIVISIISYFVMFFGSDIVKTLLIRFEDTEESHRLSAYSATLKLFSHNPIGVGYEHIMQEIIRGHYYSYGFSKYFTTLDNYFLTQLAAYGIFASLTVYSYFYFLIKAIKQKIKFPLLFKVMILLYVPFILQSFTFNWDSSIFLCLMLFGLTGYLYRYIKLLKINEIISNSNNL